MPSEGSRSAVVLELAEEFLGRYRKGERPSLKEYIDRRPDLAAEIKDVFPAMAMMENIALADESLASPAASAPGGPRGEPSAPLAQVGDFRIIREVGRGGMGVVYEAEQLSLRRHVALKVLPASALAEPRLAERFEREALAAAKLHHTHIVPVYGVGREDGHSFYVMQLIHGQPLDAVLGELRRQRKPAAATSSGLSGSGRPFWRGVARVGVQAAQALAYAHDHGVLHRDVKPSNLLLDANGDVWVADFGLAKPADGGDLTATGEIVGTLRYIPPERFHGTSDARGDVYSLGLSLYELATLRPAFDEEDRIRLIERIAHADPPPPRRVNPEVPPDLETVILKAMARDPARRYQTATELADDLKRFLDDRPIRARRAGRVELAWRWCKRNPAVASLLALVFLAMAAGTGVSVYFAVQAGIKEREASLRAAGEKAEKEHVRGLLYDAKMNLAQGALRDSRPALAVQLLADLRPNEGEKDLRHFEWHYLWRALHGERRSVEIGDNPDGPTNPFSTVTQVSADGRRVVTARLESPTPDLLNPPPGQGAMPPQFVVRVTVRDTEGGAEVLTARAEPGEPVVVLGLSPDGRRLALYSEPNVVTVWDVERRGEPLRLQVVGFPRSLAFDRTGSRLAVQLTEVAGLASNESTVEVWSLNDGKRVAHLEKAARTTLDLLEFTPDGRGLLLGGRTNAEAELWDLEAGRPRCEVPPRQGSRVSLARFSPDGRWIATAGSPGKVAVWDAATGKPAPFDVPEIPSAWAVGFSPDNRFLAVGVPGENGLEVKLLFPGREVFPTPPWSLSLGWQNTGVPRKLDLAFRADGRLISADSGRLKEWDVPAWVNNQSTAFTQPGELWVSLRFSGNGSRMAGTGSLPRPINPDAEMGPDLGTVWVKDVGAEKPSFALTSSGWRVIAGSDLSADGRRLAVRWKGTRVVAQSDLRPGGPPAEQPPGGDPSYWGRSWRSLLLVGPAPDGMASPLGLAVHAAWLAETADDLSEIIDVDTGRVLMTVRGSGAPYRLSPDGRYARDGTHREQNIDPFGGSWAFLAPVSGSVWDVDAGREVCRVRPAGANVLVTAFSPVDGRLAAWSGVDRTRPSELALWDLKTGRTESVTQLAPALSNYPQELVFSPDGRRLAGLSETWPGGILAGGNAPGKIVVWDVEGPPRVILEKPTVLPEVNAMSNEHVVLAFSPDGSLLAATPEGRDVIVWDLATGQERAALRAHPGTVAHLVFSPDGRRLLSAGRSPNRFFGPFLVPADDLEGKLWDLATGQDVLSLPLSLPVHFDGGRILTPYKGRLRVYDGTPAFEPPR